MSRKLDAHERQMLKSVLGRAEDTTVLVFGEGADRVVSFYAENTRLEARIAIPDEGPDA